jgi:hypothetical protein
MVDINYIFVLRQLLILSAPIFVLCGIIGWFTKPTSCGVFIGLTMCLGVSIVLLLCLFFGSVAEKPAFGHPMVYYAQACIYWAIPYFVFFLLPSVLGGLCGMFFRWRLRKSNEGSQGADVPVR